MNAKLLAALKARVVLWIGFLFAVVAWVVAFTFSDTIENNKLLICIVLILAIPGCITYAVMATELVKRFRFKLLALAPLLLFPKIFMVLASVGPFAYLLIQTITDFRSKASDAVKPIS